MRASRALRKAMGLPEVLLWKELRDRPGGYKFRRQVPQHPYTLDFACLEARLAIEVDGEAHNRGNRPHRDAARDQALAQRGFRTLRLSASDVLDNLEGCVMAIVNACGEAGPPPPRQRRGPPPRAGEDFR